MKSSHTYFNDLGLRNFSLNMMGRLTGFPQMGFLFQNFVYHQLRDRFTGPIDPVKYWRSKDKAEVDFIIEQGLTPLPVEVKCIDMRQPAISSGFRSFLRQYHPAEAWIINLGLSAEVTVDKTIVRFLPWHFFLENPALNA